MAAARPASVGNTPGLGVVKETTMNHAKAETLGCLYDEVLFFVTSTREPSLSRELDRLSERYCKGDIEWVLGVVRDDMGDAE